MCHLGNPWFQDAAEVLYKNDNVYGDISGLTLGDFEYKFERYVAMRLKDMITYMGDPGSQLMYGSDWPLVNMKPYIKLLNELEFTDEQLENVAWRTAQKVFKIDESVLGNGRGGGGAAGSGAANGSEEAGELGCEAGPGGDAS
jgi:predicted TIM-barrel fold metal-dependent hydrolase